MKGSYNTHCVGGDLQPNGNTKRMRSVYNMEPCQNTDISDGSTKRMKSVYNMENETSKNLIMIAKKKGSSEVWCSR